MCTLCWSFIKFIVVQSATQSSCATFHHPRKFSNAHFSKFPFLPQHQANLGLLSVSVVLLFLEVPRNCTPTVHSLCVELISLHVLFLGFQAALSGIHSISLSNSIPLNGYTTVGFAIYSGWTSQVSPLFFLNVNSTTMNFHITFFVCGHILLFWGIRVDTVEQICLSYGKYMFNVLGNSSLLSKVQNCI